MNSATVRISRGGAIFASAVFLGIVAGCASSSPPASSAAGSPDTPPPAALAGEWGIQVKFPEHTVDGVLRFSADRHFLIGSFSDDEGNQSELSKLRIEDGRISWEMDRKNGTIVAKGRIEGTIMSGKMKLRRYADDDSGFGVSGGGRRGGGGGRRVGEPDSFAWTAIKRAAPQESPK